MARHAGFGGLAPGQRLEQHLRRDVPVRCLQREHLLPCPRTQRDPVRCLNDVPFATALVEGYRDCVGSDAYNLKLSDRRAESVYDCLATRGVDPARLNSVARA
jgi:hypothetical protein